MEPEVRRIMKFIMNCVKVKKTLRKFYLCKHKQPAVTKNGKPYENVIYRIRQAQLMQNLGTEFSGN